MENWLSEFSIDKKSVVAIIGCGGKTSLMEELCHQTQQNPCKTLLSTTTKIFIPDNPSYTFLSADDTPTHNGIFYMGNINAKIGKLFSLDLTTLEKTVYHYDYSFLECDGSKRLSLKGWADYEPVVPSFATHTIGVIAFHALGKPIDETTVHRPLEFCKLTNSKLGETITLTHIAKMIGEPYGLFQKAVGTKFLFINQLESDSSKVIAEELVQVLHKMYPQSVWGKIVLGSLARKELYGL